MTDSKQTLQGTFNPEMLTSLRSVLASNSGFAALLSTVFVFEIVIDANMMISDILARRRHKGHPCNNERLVKAGILKLHIPSGAVLEMETRAIPKVSKKKKIPIAELMVVWQDYKSALVIHSGYDEAKEQIKDLKDTDDIIYVELMRDIQALGVLTHDRHFDFLELKAFNHVVLKDIQSYTIKVTNYLSFLIGGVYGVALTGMGVVKIIKALLALWKRAPRILQVAVLGGAVLTLWHNKSRENTISSTKKIVKIVGNGLGVYAEFVTEESSSAETTKAGILKGRTA